LEHTAATVIVDSRGAGAVFTQMAMQFPFSGTMRDVPIVQSAPGPNPTVGFWVAEQETMEEPGGQAGAYPGEQPHPPAGWVKNKGGVGFGQLPKAVPPPNWPFCTALHVMVASAALKVVSLGAHWPFLVSRSRREEEVAASSVATAV
jgi:hypothetical protein